MRVFALFLFIAYLRPLNHRQESSHERLMSQVRILEENAVLARPQGSQREVYAEQESTTRTMPRFAPFTRVFFKCLRMGLGMPSGKSMVE